MESPGVASESVGIPESGFVEASSVASYAVSVVVSVVVSVGVSPLSGVPVVSVLSFRSEFKS